MPANTPEVVRALRELKRKSRVGSKPVGPSGLPSPTLNDDNYTGTYEGESLTDPGFNHNGVVGTGSGPVIGMTRSLR